MVFSLSFSQHNNYIKINIITSIVIFGETNVATSFFISASKDVEREHTVEKNSVVRVKSYRKDI